MIVVAIVLLTVGTVMLARDYSGTVGDAPARVAAALAIVGGTIFTVQIGGLDGFVMPALADQLAAGGEETSILAVADAMQALDVALLGIVVLVYFGGVFLALGTAMQRTTTFAPWIRWTALGAGALAVPVGVAIYLDVATVAANYGFRVVALAVTIAALGIAVELRRGTVEAPASAAAAPA